MWTGLRALFIRYVWIFHIAVLIVIGVLGTQAERLYLALFPGQEESAPSVKLVFYVALFLLALLVFWHLGRIRSRQSISTRDSESE